MASIWISNFIKNWDRFWFSSQSEQRIRVFRILLGMVLFGFYFSRLWDLEFFYTDSGILKLSTVPEVMITSYRFSLLYWVKSLALVWVLHLVFLASLFAMVLGVFPRVSAFLALVLHLSFLHRNMSVAYGVDSISTFFLFCLSFANSKGGKGKSKSAILESVALRLLQIQVCVIYAYSGFEKLKGVLWWKGEAVWYALANYQITRFDFSWIASFPLLIVIATYTTVVWEAYFPVLVWIKPLNRSVLLFGVALHLAIAFFVYIPFFGALMISTYVLFLNPADLNRLLKVAKTIQIKVKSFRLKTF